MKDARSKISISFCLCAIILFSCNEGNDKTAKEITAPPSGLSSVVTILPEAKGYEAFNRNCMSCHSARYVEMQPNLPEKSWLAIVTKMQKTFGAPIPDSSIAEIVNYLVTIKGKS